MSKINILDPSIFNRIAAGEVVESPYSVVKELVENSIDAGADSIAVEISGGGIESITVTDNGKGISKEDMPLAFLPHATSKIRTLDDLNAIGTLGFRGEALPSIASVAAVTMVSKQRTTHSAQRTMMDEESEDASEIPNPSLLIPNSSALGYSVAYINGQLTAQGEAGAPYGTSVAVKDLFQNIPARRKFLKKPAQEKAKITELIEKLILANPDTAFQYSADGKTVYRTDGQGKESAVYAIYGEMMDSLLPVSGGSAGVKISGYVSEPTFSKHNRAYQHLVVNGRVVENEDIAYSVYLAYKDFLMTRRFPVYVLYIDIPNDLIDVNVHPNKMSVKFVDVTSVKKAVYHAVRKSILPALSAEGNRVDGGGWTVDGIEDKGQGLGARVQELGVRGQELGNEKNEILSVSSQPTNTNSRPYHPPFAIHHPPFNPFAAETFSETPIQEPALTRKSVMESFFNAPRNACLQITNADGDDETKNEKRKTKNDGLNQITNAEEDCAVGREPGSIAVLLPHIVSGDGAEPPPYGTETPSLPIHYSLFTTQSLTHYPSAIRPIQIAGKLFNTYILVQSGSDAYLIDQHAAHERILYDRYLTQIDNGKLAVQELLVPYAFDVTHAEAEFLESNLAGLEKLGFSLKPVGETAFQLSAIPSVLAEARLSDFIVGLLENPHNALKRSDFLRESTAQSACKAAVKGGDDLPESEIQSLIMQMQASHGVPLCPHGRPTVVKLTKLAIEKWFGRAR